MGRRDFSSLGPGLRRGDGLALPPHHDVDAPEPPGGEGRRAPPRSPGVAQAAASRRPRPGRAPPLGAERGCR